MGPLGTFGRSVNIRELAVLPLRLFLFPVGQKSPERDKNEEEHKNDNVLMPFGEGDEFEN